jgi:hypothetical protein
MSARIGVAVGLLLAAVALSQRLTDIPLQQQAEIRAVIEAQLAAFQRDDAVRAFSFAAPGIRQTFQTPERFLQMVKQGYMPLYRPAKVEFTAIGVLQGLPTQVLTVTDQEGVHYQAYYVMERQPDRSWKIAGVYLEPLPAEAPPKSA